MRAYLIILTSFSLLFSFQSIATVINLTINQQNVSAKIENIDYPEEILSQELKSGLPNVIELLISISHREQQVAQRLYSMTITYDLWDEHYSLIHLSLGNIKKLTFNSDKDLINYLSNISASNLLTDNKYPKNDAMILSLRVFFNPIKSEKIKKIKAWVKSSYINSNQIQPAANRSNSQFNQNTKKPENSQSSPLIGNGPKFQKLFDKILEEYMEEDKKAAQWKSEVLTKDFTIKSLLSEKK